MVLQVISLQLQEMDLHAEIQFKELVFAQHGINEQMIKDTKQPSWCGNRLSQTKHFANFGTGTDQQL